MVDCPTEYGLGDENARFNVYIENRPPLDEYEQLWCIKALEQGDIANIAQQTGNHWRKIFNVYAKLVFALDAKKNSSWQSYRDDFLLSKKSEQALLFSRPDFQKQGIHIITGRTYAQSLQLDAQLISIDADFQMDIKKRLLVVPYFDYRQLSNEKLMRLVGLIQSIGY
jgi:hypothetical protein